MFRVFLLLSVLSLCGAVIVKDSVVITSAEVPVDQPLNLNLNAGSAYRVYATYASGNTDDYAKNVKIYDASGASLTVAGLDQAKPNSGPDYFLDNLRFLRAPIYIHDMNKGAATVVPYTVYVVNAGATSFPVVSARTAPQLVDSNNGFIAAGLTVLSAEKYFTMYSFDIGNAASMIISSVGFETSDSNYNVMSLNSAWEAKLSFLSVYGPITTLFNAKWGINARFQFQFTRNTKYEVGNLSPGASFALLSPGYMSSTQSYKMPYTSNDALQRSYTFGQNNYVQTYYMVRDIQTAENVNFQYTTAEGTVTDINMKSDDNAWRGQWANKLSLSVQNNVNHVPRFLFQITSGSSLSFSLLGVLLVSLFSKFY